MAAGPNGEQFAEIGIDIAGDAHLFRITAIPPYRQLDGRLTCYYDWHNLVTDEKGRYGPLLAPAPAVPTQSRRPQVLAHLASMRGVGMPKQRSPVYEP